MSKSCIKFQLKSTEELFLIALKSDAKFKEKLTLGSKNDMKNLVNFNTNRDQPENLHFDVLLLSKVYNVWAKEIQGNHDTKSE